MEITEEEIIDISPDGASTKNAQKLYAKTKWSVKKSERAVWSEIYGSGKKPYLTQMDIGALAFKCSCPSRKFPCKHGLALGLYLANKGIDSIAEESEPLWVEEWIDKRRKKSEAKPKKVSDPKKVQESSDAKWKRAVEDIQVVEIWLLDVIKLGILDFPDHKHEYWERLRKRMVDIKLSGINTFFTLLEEIDYEQDWEEKVLKILSDIYMLIESVKQHGKLERNFKQELELLLGWSLSKHKLLSDEKAVVVDDVWMVVGVETNKTDSLTSRKVYLYGTATNRWAYILEFAHGSAFFEDQYRKGSLIQAKLLFYSGVLQIRAYLKLRGAKTEFDASLLAPLKSIKIAYNYYKERKMLFPWIFEQPLFIADCNIVKQEEAYFLVDREDSIIKLDNFQLKEYLYTLSQSKGKFFDAFIVQKRERTEFLGFYREGEVETS